MPSEKKFKPTIVTFRQPRCHIPTEVAAPYIYRSQAKAGTTSFFAYATVYVICRNKRVTLGIHAVHRQET